MQYLRIALNAGQTVAVGSPADLLRVEQRLVQGVLARMAHSVHTNDRSDFLKHAGTLRLLLQYHNQKQAALYAPRCPHATAPAAALRGSV